MPRRPSRTRLALLVILLVGAACKGPPSRPKTDVVQLTYGDYVTGEIKELQQGKLRLKTAALDTVYVEWNKILQLASTYFFEFEDHSGVRHFGRITSEAPGTITLVDKEGGSKTLSMEEIVRIRPIGESFWSQLDGNFSLGFSYNKGSDVGQLSINGGLDYVTRKIRNDLDFSFEITTDSGGESTARDTLSLTHSRYRNHWFGWGSGSLEKNESLGLDLRALIAGGVGVALIQSNEDQLDVGLGLDYSQEDSNVSSSSSGAVEGVVFVSYAIFRFSNLDVDSDFTLTIYPGITDSGRLRGELDADVRREIVKSLFIELSGYYSYDNQPLPGSEGSDFGVVTSLGWSF